MLNRLVKIAGVGLILTTILSFILKANFYICFLVNKYLANLFIFSDCNSGYFSRARVLQIS